MIAPVAAPMPAPSPVGVSHELRMKELIARTATTEKKFLFIKSTPLTNLTAQVREGCMTASKRLKQLCGDSARFLQSAEAIFLLKNAKLIKFHSAEQS